MLMMTKPDDEILGDVPMDARLLSIGQTSIILSVSVSKLRVLADCGALTPVTIGKRSIRYRFSDVIAYSRSLK